MTSGEYNDYESVIQQVSRLVMSNAVLRREVDRLTLALEAKRPCSRCDGTGVIVTAVPSWLAPASHSIAREPCPCRDVQSVSWCQDNRQRPVPKRRGVHKP